MSSISYDIVTKNVREILNDWVNDAIRIPDHQRDEIWPAKRKEALIENCMLGLPMPNITFRHTIEGSLEINWLEDGQQRCWSLRRFFQNEVAWRGKYYKDLTLDEQIRFLTYKVHVLVFRNATKEQTITIFDNFQNGVALTPGQRFHARQATLLVDFARKSLLIPGSGFYDRATSVWGPHKHTDDKKQKNFLKNAMALIGGAAHGVEYITTSYDLLGPILTKEFDEEVAHDRIDALLSIFEEADAQHPVTLGAKKKQWPAGNINGFILYSLIMFPDHRDSLVEGWVNFLVQLRRGEKALKTSLHANSPKNNNLNSAKWRIGYENIFVAAPDLDTDTASTESSDEDE
jgi:hypothetical protein